ncbi:MAG: hypothetical protein ACREDU_02460 [Methylocella sp.]
MKLETHPFSPSLKQQRFAYYFISMPYIQSPPAKKPIPTKALDALPIYPSFDEVCNAIGIHRSTAYKWFKDPAFIQWWSSQLAASIALLAPRFTRALLDGAEFGRTGPLRIFFRMFAPPSCAQLMAGGFPAFNEDLSRPLEPDEPPFPPPEDAKNSTQCDIEIPQSPSTTEKS